MAWQHFTRDEFSCNCGCGTNNISSQLLDRLEIARRDAGVPFVITSGSRCPEHNAEVSTVGNTSPHLGGWAADIHAPDSRSRFAILQSLLSTGFTRIGIGKQFIHCDLDPTKFSRVIWTYYSEE